MSPTPAQKSDGLRWNAPSRWACAVRIMRSAPPVRRSPVTKVVAVVWTKESNMTGFVEFRKLMRTDLEVGGSDWFVWHDRIDYNDEPVCKMFIDLAARRVVVRVVSDDAYVVATLRNAFIRVTQGFYARHPDPLGRWGFIWEE